MSKPQGKHLHRPCTHHKVRKAASSAGGLRCTAGPPEVRQGEPGNTEHRARFWATCPRRHTLVCLLTSGSPVSLPFTGAFVSPTWFSRQGAFSWDARELGHPGPATVLEAPRGPGPTSAERPLSGRCGAVRALGAVLEKLVAGGGWSQVAGRRSQVAGRRSLASAEVGQGRSPGAGRALIV